MSYSSYDLADPPQVDDRHRVEMSITDPDAASTWTPVDLSDALAGVDVAPPTLLHRTDGVPLLYEGRTHQFAGESESCKTWAALLAVADVLEAGGRVLWIDFEDDDRGIVARLRSLMVPTASIAQRFTYIRPEEPLTTRDGRATGGAVAFGQLLDQSFALAVVDGVTEAMTTEGLDPMSNTDAAVWSRRVPKPIASRTGAAVVVIDHVTKAGDTRGRYAIGGQHKLAGLTGAAYRFDATTRLSRAMGAEPVTGAVTVTITKDRPGYVRAHAVSDRVATLEITAYPDGGVIGRLRPVGEVSTVPESALLGRIAEYLATYEGAAKMRIETEVEGRAESIRAALTWMAAPDRAWVLIERVGNAHRHTLTEAGRKELLS